MLKHHQSGTEPINKKRVDNSLSNDQQSAQMVRQAIKDDQGLSAVAKDIKVSVKEGTVTLEGEVSTDQQMNLATNTAGAVAVGDRIETQIGVNHNK